jgi:hypothetical protein
MLPVLLLLHLVDLLLRRPALLSSPLLALLWW